MRLTVALSVLAISSAIAKVDHDGAEAKIDIGKADKNHKATHKEGAELIDQKKLYVKLFKAKRRDHANAVHSIFGIEIDKQRPFVEEIIRNIKKILEETRETLERVQYVAKPGTIPDTETVREALSKTLENTAFFSDLALRFSGMVKPKVKDVKSRTVLMWAYETSKASNLLDESSENIISFMAQELDFIPRNEGYENPYGAGRTKEELELEAAEEMKKEMEAKLKARKHDAKIKKGPKAEL